MANPKSKAFFDVRGVVLTPEDLSLPDWPARAHRAGLTVIALHPTPSRVMDFVRTDAGAAFLEQCRRLGIAVEYELHAVGELLPRGLFEKDASLFRMNDAGDRTPDANLCVHSETALSMVGEKALEIARVLRPTTGRYFFWGDDGLGWCRCPKCRGLTESDQALLFENRLLEALRTFDPKAHLAHLAYANTLEPPKQIAPQPGLFLEFAPIQRHYDKALSASDDPENRRHAELLDANLRLFPPDTAQVLEYWLDCSRFSKWTRPAVKIPWAPEVFAADLKAYGGRGIRRITTFAVYVDAEYVKMYGEPPLEEYGRLLREWPGGA